MDDTKQSSQPRPLDYLMGIGRTTAPFLTRDRFFLATGAYRGPTKAKGKKVDFVVNGL